MSYPIVTTVFIRGKKVLNHINEAKTNPIQSQFKPKRTQSKPIFFGDEIL